MDKHQDRGESGHDSRTYKHHGGQLELQALGCKLFSSLSKKHYLFIPRTTISLTKPLLNSFSSAQARHIALGP